MRAARAARPLPRLKKLLLRERDATAVTPPHYHRTRGFSPGRGKWPAVGLTPELYGGQDDDGARREACGDRMGRRPLGKKVATSTALSWHSRSPLLHEPLGSTEPMV
jgi:hypothetical protein